MHGLGAIITSWTRSWIPASPYNLGIPGCTEGTVRFRPYASLLCVVLWLLLPLWAAGQGLQNPIPNPNFPSQGPSSDEETQDRIRREMAKKANQERQGPQ